MAAQQIKRRPKAKLLQAEKDSIITMAEENPTLTHDQIAQLNGCERSTVTRVLNLYNIDRLQVENYKAHRADIFAGIQEMIIRSITPAQINKATLMQRMAAVGILYDKESIERGVRDDDKSRPLVVIVKGGNVQVNAGSASEKASRAGYPQDNAGYPQIGDSPKLQVCDNTGE